MSSTGSSTVIKNIISAEQRKANLEIYKKIAEYLREHHDIELVADSAKTENARKKSVTPQRDVAAADIVVAEGLCPRIITKLKNKGKPCGKKVMKGYSYCSGCRKKRNTTDAVVTKNTKTPGNKDSASPKSKEENPVMIQQYKKHKKFYVMPFYGMILHMEEQEDGDMLEVCIAELGENDELLPISQERYDLMTELGKECDLEYYDEFIAGKFADKKPTYKAYQDLADTFVDDQDIIYYKFKDVYYAIMCLKQVDGEMNEYELDAANINILKKKNISSIPSIASSIAINKFLSQAEEENPDSVAMYGESDSLYVLNDKYIIASIVDAAIALGKLDKADNIINLSGFDSAELMNKYNIVSFTPN